MLLNTLFVLLSLLFFLPNVASYHIKQIHKPTLLHDKRSMAPWVEALVSIAATLSPTSIPLTNGLSTSTLSLVKNNAWTNSLKSWEIGTLAEALTEFSWPALSVYAPVTAPIYPLNSTYNASDVMSIAQRTVATKPADITALMLDGASGDPASIGVAVILANRTRSDPSDWSYAIAAEDQLHFLLNDVPRSDSGAISHRDDDVQLWADFVYMGPPFLAYWGLVVHDKSLLIQAHDQCRLYREALQDEGGLWKHIIYGPWQDLTHWGTGNGWAASGMMRVLATLNQSSTFGEDLLPQQANLTQWVGEIITASWSFQQKDGTLLNTIDAAPSDSFRDLSSTALIAATTYRWAAHTGNTTHIPNANAAMQAVIAGVDSKGWMNPVVDPYSFDKVLDVNTTPGSPEGQSFVLLLTAAWRDFGVWANQTSILTTRQ